MMNISRSSIALMGSKIEITVVSDAGKIETDNFTNKAFNIFHSIVAKYSRFIESSELNILNRNQGRFFEVSKDLFDMVDFGIELAKISDGVFDITIIDLLEAYGYSSNYDFSVSKKPGFEEKIRELLKNRRSVFDIELDRKNLSIKLMHGQRIDLGSFAKGFGIKLAANLFLENNFNNFFINAGGDVYAHGLNENGEIWTASLFNPERTLEEGEYSEYGKIAIDNEAIACTGGWARKVGEFNHLLNPITGSPLEIKPNVFIASKDPLFADAFATLLYLVDLPRNVLDKYGVRIIKTMFKE